MRTTTDADGAFRDQGIRNDRTKKRGKRMWGWLTGLLVFETKERERDTDSCNRRDGAVMYVTVSVRSTGADGHVLRAQRDAEE